LLTAVLTPFLSHRQVCPDNSYFNAPPILRVNRKMMSGLGKGHNQKSPTPFPVSGFSIYWA
jgi:hypothetical protein